MALHILQGAVHQQVAQENLLVAPMVNLSAADQKGSQAGSVRQPVGAHAYTAPPQAPLCTVTALPLLIQLLTPHGMPLLRVVSPTLPHPLCLVSRPCRCPLPLPHPLPQLPTSITSLALCVRPLLLSGWHTAEETTPQVSSQPHSGRLLHNTTPLSTAHRIDTHPTAAADRL